MLPVSNIDFVRALPLFSGLTEHDKDVMMKDGRIRRFGRGEHVFLHGDTIRSFYIICNGTIKLFRETPDGKEKTADLLIMGSMLGESEIFDVASTHQINALAVEDSILMEFPMGWLKENAKRHSAF